MRRSKGLLQPRSVNYGITEERKISGELFSMSDTTFVPEKTTLVLSNLHNAWLDEVSVAHSAKNRSRHFQKWLGPRHNRGDASRVPESVRL